MTLQEGLERQGREGLVEGKAHRGRPHWASCLGKGKSHENANGT